ncbi:glutathionylspermidine synthase family protein [Orenia marismortui]|uniref:glutathionylspermidine synthase family protein n=1 Tax=Orenia marismortui TaxID=46469 RepID=UPI00036714F1|nr:glutathionylspermidine synthase family protein [Orenia marismortui]
MEEVFLKYKDILIKDIEKYYKDYQKIYDNLEDSPAYYHGKVIPILYQPLFFDNKEIKIFKELTNKLTVILNKVIDRYLSDSDFRSYFGFSKQLEELILSDPGYSSNFPMARFDIFYFGDQGFQFCELNADGSSGMVKTNTLEKYFLSAKAIEELKENYKISYCELLESWVDTLLDNYQEFNPEDKRPNIAIMDFSGYGMVAEFDYFKALIKNRGYEVEIVDPREVEYRDNKLYYGDFKIDLIYRRAVTMDLMKHYDEIEDLIKAYLDSNVCLVGPIRSQIIHNKIIFSILHDDEKVSFLTDNERSFIKDHIPYTAIVDPKDEDMLKYISNNQENLVLKPMDLYGSEGVSIGRDLSKDEWSLKMNEINGKSYLIQEFCQVPEREMAVFEGNKLEFEDFKYTLGLFIYDQEFQGIYTRAGKDNVIASATGCVTLPNLTIKKK